jgi:hypothetical protein
MAELFYLHATFLDHALRGHPAVPTQNFARSPVDQFWNRNGPLIIVTWPRAVRYAVRFLVWGYYILLFSKMSRLLLQPRRFL